MLCKLAWIAQVASSDDGRKNHVLFRHRQRVKHPVRHHDHEIAVPKLALRGLQFDFMDHADWQAGGGQALHAVLSLDKGR